MKAGAIFDAFGCIWQIDVVHEVSEEYAKEHQLRHNIYYQSRAIMVPDGYDGPKMVTAIIMSKRRGK